MATTESVGLPVAGSTTVDRIKFSVGGSPAAPFNLIVRAVIPTSLLYVLCNKGPPTILGLGAPDQGAETRAHIGGDQLTI